MTTSRRRPRRPGQLCQNRRRSKAFLDEYVIGQDESKKRLVGRGLSALQTSRTGQAPFGRRASEIEYSSDRSDRNGQDAARADAGARSERSVLHRRCDEPDRGRLRRRGRREYSSSSAAVGRRRSRKGPAGNYLHRRDRQDLPQGRQPVDHPRRFGRRRPAGVAEDSRRNDREYSDRRRPQASAAGISAARHDEYSVHLRRCVHRARKGRRETFPHQIARVSRPTSRPANSGRAKRSKSSSPKI